MSDNYVLSFFFGQFSVTVSSKINGKNVTLIASNVFLSVIKLFHGQTYYTKKKETMSSTEE